MQREYFIGLDVHCQETEIAVVTATGRLSQRMRVATTIPAFAQAAKRAAIEDRLPDHSLVREMMQCLWSGYDASTEQVTTMRRSQ